MQTQNGTFGYADESHGTNVFQQMVLYLVKHVSLISKIRLFKKQVKNINPSCCLLDSIKN